MRKTARVAISDIALAQNPAATIEHAMRILEKELGGPPEQIRAYCDPGSMSLTIEGRRPDDSWVSSASAVTNNMLVGAVPGAVITYDDLKKAANDYALFQQQYSPISDHPPRRIYLNRDDDQELPEEPEPMWSGTEVLGWRLFGIEGSGRLRGQFSQVWTEKTLVAGCDYHPEEAHGKKLVPGWGCECGIYASSFPVTPIANHRVLAEVSLSGRIIEHEYGYRAEKATILRLWATKEDRDRLAPYGVPVLLRR